MTYSASTLAHHLLALAKDHQLTFSALKLQRLLFCAQVQHLSHHGVRLCDSAFELHSNGPALRSLDRDSAAGEVLEQDLRTRNLLSRLVARHGALPDHELDSLIQSALKATGTFVTGTSLPEPVLEAVAHRLLPALERHRPPAAEPLPEEALCLA